MEGPHAPRLRSDAGAGLLGLPVGLLHYGILAILSLKVVATLSFTALSLAVGPLIASGATALLVPRSFGRMLIVVSVVGLIAMLSGVYNSVFLDSKPAPTIVLILTAIFLAALLRISHVTVDPLAERVFLMRRSITSPARAP